MKKIIKLSVLFFLFFTLSPISYLLSPVSFVLAQDSPIDFDDALYESNDSFFDDASLELEQGAETGEIRLFVNESKLLDEEAKRVAVGNPEVADVRVISDKEIMLLGKSKGRTNLLIWDRLGNRKVLYIEVIEQDLQKLVDYLSEVIKTVGIKTVRVVAKGQNVLLIGSVFSSAEKEQLDTLTENIDEVINIVQVVSPQKKRPRLIQVDVKILEMSKSALKELGIAWAQNFHAGEIADLTPSGAWLNTFSQLTPGLVKVGRWQYSAMSGALNLLFEQGKAKLLAHPKLVTDSGKKANFRAGGEIPITVSGENPHIEWKPYGVSLEIEPTSNSMGSISTKLIAEVSSLDWAYATQSGGNTPAIKTRNTQTEVSIKQGETLLIAGLIQSEESKNLQKVPMLGSIPVLGELFKSTRFQNNQTELVIFVTPIVIPLEEEKKVLKDAVLRKKQEQKKKSAEIKRMVVFKNEMEKQLSVSKQEKEGNKQQAKVKKKKSENGFEATEEVFWPPGSKENYVRTIQREVSRFITRPKGTEDFSGTAVLKLHLLADGRLKDIKLIESSGHHFLNKAAVKGIKQNSPYPAFPLGVKNKDVWLNIPISFKNLKTNKKETKEERVQKAKKLKRQKKLAKLKKIEQQKKRKKNRQEEIRAKKQKLVELKKKQDEGVFKLEEERKKKKSENGFEATEEVFWPPGSKENYVRTIQREVSRFITRPKGTEDFSGTAVLKLHLLADGRLKDIKLIESSGHHFLNKAAVKGIKQNSPYPAFPLGVKNKDVWLNIPISFKNLKTNKKETKEERVQKAKKLKRQKKLAKLKKIEQQKKRKKNRQEEIRAKKQKLVELKKKQDEGVFKLEEERKKKDLEKLREEVKRQKGKEQLAKLAKERKEERKRKVEEKKRQRRKAALERIKIERQKAKEAENRKIETEKRKKEAGLKNLAEEKKRLKLEAKEKRKQERLKKQNEIIEKQLKKAEKAKKRKTEKELNKKRAKKKKPLAKKVKVIKKDSWGKSSVAIETGIEEEKTSRLLDEIEEAKIDYLSRGKEYYQIGEYESAIEEFEQIRRANPNYKIAQKYLVLCQKKWEKKEKRKFKQTGIRISGF